MWVPNSFVGEKFSLKLARMTDHPLPFEFSAARRPDRPRRPGESTAGDHFHQIGSQSIFERLFEFGGNVHLGDAVPNGLPDQRIGQPDAPCKTNGTDTRSRIACNRSKSKWGPP